MERTNDYIGNTARESKFAAIKIIVDIEEDKLKKKYPNIDIGKQFELKLINGPLFSIRENLANDSLKADLLNIARLVYTI